METLIMKKPGIRKQIDDVILDISWAKVAKRYFDRPPSWIFHKIDNTQEKGGFTPAELEQFKEALTDLADRIRRVADGI